jgi:hypothetical protein
VKLPIFDYGVFFLEEPEEEEADCAGEGYGKCNPRNLVLPLTVVDNSTITPICLTVISDALSNQEAFSFSHFKRRGLYEHAYLFVLALNLPSSFSRAALAS